ncbi:hypothetical protein PFISCL1PPCAC_27221, partial [Pristionchus fissidentatus]
RERGREREDPHEIVESLLMASMSPLLLLLLTVISIRAQSFVNTRLDVSNIQFTTAQPFIFYFDGKRGSGLKVFCECHASSSTGQIIGSYTTYIPSDTDDRSVRIADMSFSLNNPADYLILTCSIRLRMTDNDDKPWEVVDYAQVYTGQNNDKFTPSSYPRDQITVKFATLNDWKLILSINKQCNMGEMGMNFNCQTNCQTDLCGNQAQICCPEEIDKTMCTCIGKALPSDTCPTFPPDYNPDLANCTNEDLYFWIMIGLACLAGLLLILLIICLCYICCALSSEDSARKNQQTPQQTESARVPPPVYLATPPRDPRYGYRGPPVDQYGRPLEYREETYDADIDSLAAECSEASARREARV